MVETADDILLAFLRTSGVSLPEGVATCAELDSEAVFAACAYCLNAISQERGEQQRVPSKLMKNPGARFRACTALATGITALGFDGEVGFNLFLYPSEAETRKVLLFLSGDTPVPQSDLAWCAAMLVTWCDRLTGMPHAMFALRPVLL